MNQLEVGVFKTSFYSVYEDIDHAYATVKSPEIDPNASLDSLRNLILTLIESLESY